MEPTQSKKTERSIFFDILGGRTSLFCGRRMTIFSPLQEAKNTFSIIYDFGKQKSVALYHLLVELFYTYVWKAPQKDHASINSHNQENCLREAPSPPQKTIGQLKFEIIGIIGKSSKFIFQIQKPIKVLKLKKKIKTKSSELAKVALDKILLLKGCKTLDNTEKIDLSDQLFFIRLVPDPPKNQSKNPLSA